VNLEKAFDRVPREVIRWAVNKLGVEEWTVSAVMSMYTGAKTVVRTVYGNSNGFEVKVGFQLWMNMMNIIYCHASQTKTMHMQTTHQQMQKHRHIHTHTEINRAAM